MQVKDMKEVVRGPARFLVTLGQNDVLEYGVCRRQEDGRTRYFPEEGAVLHVQGKGFIVEMVGGGDGDILGRDRTESKEPVSETGK